MNLTQLTKYSNKFLKDNFDLELTIPIEANGRLTRSMGRLAIVRNMNTNERKALRIELSKRLLTYGTEEEILDVLSHELVHYALLKLGKPFMDGQACFENTLKKLGVSATETISLKQPHHAYKCKCSTHYRKRAIKHHGVGMVCGGCLQGLEYLGKVMHGG